MAEASRHDGLDLGASFIVRLPTFDGVFGSVVTAEGQRASLLKGMKICVVDDEADSLEVFGALLAAEGAHVELSTNAPQALEKLKATDFDLLISDIAMPGMSGRQLIEERRS